jgi:hypothetical protein
VRTHTRNPVCWQHVIVHESWRHVIVHVSTVKSAQKLEQFVLDTMWRLAV